MPSSMTLPEISVSRGLAGLSGWADRRRRILVVTLDVLTPRMAGPAIRAYHIASALASEHDVVLVTLSGSCEIAPTAFAARAVTAAETTELEAWCDVIVLQGFVLRHAPPLRTSTKIMVVDLYDPLHLERLELVKGEDLVTRAESVSEAVDTLNEQLARGDFFLCASQKQRDFWLGELAGVGRINPLTYDVDHTLNKLLAVVPFGLPDKPPVHTVQVLKGVHPGIGPDDPVILWAGGVYNWLDPVTLIEAVDRLRERWHPTVRLFFMGLRHPSPAAVETQAAVDARARAAALGLTGLHVFFNDDWIAYEERHNYLLEADIGVSTHLDHLETAYSFRARILD
jgi:hypothetical protein